MGSARTGLGTWRTIMAATGVHASLVPLVVAVLITVIWRGGMIVAIGPLTLAAKLPVVVAVPTLLAVACAISHVAPRTPVIARSGRTVIARGASHLTILASGWAVVLLGDLLSPVSTTGAATRNLMVFSAAALLVSAFAGPTYAWAPVLVLFGMGVLSNPDEATWSLHALLMTPAAQPLQLAVMVPVCLLAVLVTALDPLNRGYLPRRSRPTHR